MRSEDIDRRSEHICSSHLLIVCPLGSLKNESDESDDESARMASVTERSIVVPFSQVVTHRHQYECCRTEKEQMNKNWRQSFCTFGDIVWCCCWVRSSVVQSCGLVNDGGNTWVCWVRFKSTFEGKWTWTGPPSVSKYYCSRRKHVKLKYFIKVIHINTYLLKSYKGKYIYWVFFIPSLIFALWMYGTEFAYRR